MGGHDEQTTNENTQTNTVPCFCLISYPSLRIDPIYDSTGHPLRMRMNEKNEVEIAAIASTGLYFSHFRSSFSSPPFSYITMQSLFFSFLGLYD